MVHNLLFVSALGVRLSSTLPFLNITAKKLAAKPSKPVRPSRIFATATGSLLTDCPSESSRTPKQLWLPTPRHTYQLGRLLAANARPGDVLLLNGDLGAGKTLFARGYVQTARRDTTIDVTSPTYLLANTYPPGPECDDVDTVPTVYHMDLYRLEDASERPLIDFDRVFTSEIALIEWPDRLKRLTPRDRLEVIIEYPPDELRENKPDDQNDPWGFGDGDPAEDEAIGRYARLIPHGSGWTGRVREFERTFTASDEEQRSILVEDSVV